MGEGSDLPGDLRLVGRAAAPGSRHPGSGLLLGLHEGQPAPPELHIDPLLQPGRTLLPNPPGRRNERTAFKEKKTHKKQNIYLNPTPERKKSSPPPPVPSLLVKCVSKTGWLRLLYIYR